ncbi:MAG: family 20 glycosylhydrolase [Specibacter sp.]
MKALRRTTTAGLACAAALGLFAAVLPTAFTAPQAQAAPIVVPTPAPVVYPTNLALTGTATASSVESALPANTAAKAIDGDTGSRWSSNYVDASWLQVELAQAGPIDNVKISWPNAAARKYTLQTSINGTDWIDAKVVNSTTGPSRVDEVSLAVANAKFIRMLGGTRWSTFGYSISEFGIYATAQPAVPANLTLVPLPVASAPTTNGTFRLLPSSRIVASGDAVDAATYFAEKARKSTGFALPVVTGTATVNDVAFIVAAGESEDKAESYTLQADANGVKVSANTGAGALNGVQTLRQLFPQWIESSTSVNTPWTVEPVVISDYPRFEHRGVGIDVARSFYTVEEMKEHIDNAAQFKMNRLHIHLTDDQGWRIAIDQPAAANNPSGIKYTDLTDISGNTAMTTNPSQSEVGHTGFYTKADYQEIVKYAGDNGMMVIPEIDMPGHSNAALHAIPQLNSAKSAPKPKGTNTTTDAQGTGDVGVSSFDADNPATYEFTQQVLAQIAAMTPGPFIHIGGDESHSTTGADYNKMINAFTKQVNDVNKRVIGWNEYGSATLPANSVIQLWTGTGQGEANKIINNNAKVILSPAPKTYIPQKQDNSQQFGGTWACGGPCTLQTHYDWDPGTYLPGITDERILGVETVQWGEFIRGMEQTETYQYPRTLATAEVGWSPQGGRNYADFSKRVGALGGRMALQDLTHFKTVGVNWTTAPAAPSAMPAVVDPATLPATSPVDLGVPSTEFKGGEYVTLKHLPADAWLLANINGSGPAWVRSNSAGEAPLNVPDGLSGGAHVLTVQGAAGVLSGFASLAIAAEEVPSTTAPATTAPATTAPATTAPATTAPATTAPATTAPATTSASGTATSSATASVSPAPSASAPAGGIDLSADSVSAGGRLTITGMGFKPGSSASFTLHSTPVNLGTATVDAQGVATLGVTLPAGVAPGQHSVVIDGVGIDGKARQLSAALTITAAATAPAADDLATTGAKSTLMIGGAALALIVGLLAMAATRRRSSMH